MRSNLFGENLETTSDERFALQNPRMLKVRLDGEFFARQGAMVAYQGEVSFAYQGAGGVGKLLKKALTGEGVPLMKCSGRGDVFLAQDGNELHALDLDGDGVTVNGANVLAFESGLSWDIRRVEGASMLAGGVFNMVFTGTGRLVVSAFGTPVVLNTAEAPTFADLQSAIAWSSKPADTPGAYGRRLGPDRTRQRRGLPAGLPGSGVRHRAGQRRCEGAQPQSLTARHGANPPGR